MIEWLVMLCSLLFIVHLALLWYRPFNTAIIVGMMTLIFGLFPAFFSYYTQADEEVFYSWRNFTPIASSLDNPVMVREGIFIMCLFTLAWTVGSITGLARAPRATPTIIERANIERHYWYQHPYISGMIAILFAIWLGCAYYFYLRAGSLEVFLLPVVRRDESLGASSGYLLALYMTLPLVMLTLKLLHDGRFTRLGYALLLLCLLTPFTTHQRREFVTAVMFLAAFMVFMRDCLPPNTFTLATWHASLRPRLQKSRSLALFFISLSVLLVPVLWYMRVYLTSIYVREDAVNPLEIRSFMDVLFGSPATGFPNFMLVYEYIQEIGIQFAYSLRVLLTLPIPRAWWPDKPLDIDSLMQEHYGIMENPSTFWYADLYYNAGLFGIILAYLLAWSLSYVCEKARTTPLLMAKIAGSAFFMHSITLHKNGFYFFALKVGILLILFYGVMGILRRCAPAKDRIKPVCA